MGKFKVYKEQEPIQQKASESFVAYSKIDPSIATRERDNIKSAISDVKELPQAVQDAIKENYSEATIKEAAVEVAEDGTKTYKVTLVDASGTENPVLFNEKGEVQK